MSKIYEALELAGRQVRPETRPAAPGPSAPSEQRPAREADALSVVAGPPPFALPLEEPMKALYNSITSLLPGTEGRVIQFIAPETGAGTSTMVREFAKVVATRQRKTVLLLDANHRRANHQGVLAADMEHAWETAPGEKQQLNLKVSPVTGTSLSVSEMPLTDPNDPLPYDSPQFKGMLNRLRQRFDLVLIDSSPSSESTEGIALARNVDGVVVVMEAERTRWQVAENLTKRLEFFGGNVLGSVLNKRKYHVPGPIYRWL